MKIQHELIWKRVIFIGLVKKKKIEVCGPFISLSIIFFSFKIIIAAFKIGHFFHGDNDLKLFFFFRILSIFNTHTGREEKFFLNKLTVVYIQNDLTLGYTL